MKIQHLLATLLALGAPCLDASAQTSTTAETADLILHNGRVVTVDAELGEVEAIAIVGDRILAVGSSDQMNRLRGPSTTVVDLEGRLAIPGFIEGHAHFTGLGQSKMNLDLMTVANWDEVIAMVTEAVKAAQPGEWILGRGWHQEKWDKTPADDVEGFPTHHRLSAVSPDNPVSLTHASGHASFANQKAMELAGISGATPDPAGGEILRDDEGQPIGIFRERAQGLIGATPDPAGGEILRDDERQPMIGRARSSTRGMLRRRAAQFQRVVELATQECLSNGVTSFQDAGSSFYELERLAQMAERGELGVRLWMMIRESNDSIRQNISRFRDMKRVGGGYFTVGGIKRSIDGALGSRGAWLLEPYFDSSESVGLATATVDDVTETAQLGLENNLQVCVHAIGDRANREVLDIYEKIFRTAPDGSALRWRIEHAQHLHPDDIPRFGELGVIASMQGVHCTSDAPWVLARLGDERAEEGAYVWQKLMDSGAIVTNGTDAPVERIDPIASYYATVSRRLTDGTVFYSDQRMTRMEALQSYTINAAYAAFEEDVKGSLAPGKFADIVVLSQDILSVREDLIPATEVDLTIVGGKVAYRRGD